MHNIKYSAQYQRCIFGAFRTPACHYAATRIAEFERSPFLCCNFWHLFKVQPCQRNDLTTCKTFLKPDNETGWWPWPVFSCLWHNEIVVIRCNSPQFLAGNLFRLSFQTLKCCGGPWRAIFSFVALKWRRFLGEILTIWGSSWEGGVQFLWKSFCIFFYLFVFLYGKSKKRSFYGQARGSCQKLLSGFCPLRGTPPPLTP